MDSKNTLHAYRGIYRKKTIFLDKDSKVAIHMDATNWLDGDDITSASWSVEDDSTEITISDTSETTKIATAYLVCTEYNSRPLHVKVIAVSDAATPESCARSFLIRRTRTF